MRERRQISFEEYGRRVGQVFYPLQARAPKDCRLSIGDFSSRRSGEFRFTSSAIEHDGPIGGIRQWRHIARDTPDEFVLIVADTATLRYTQFRRDAELPAGSMMLLDARNPYEYERCFSGRVSCYHLPGRVLRDVLPFPEDFCAIRIDTGAGVGSALRSFVGLAWNQGVLDSGARDGLFRDLATLIPAAAQVQSKPKPSPLKRQDALERAEAFIDANLSNPALSVAMIARAAGVSVSRLHALAQQKGLGIGRMVLARRLDACAAALGRGHACRLVDLTLENGFVSPSHFSRAFRARFGCTPTAYARQRAN